MGGLIVVSIEHVLRLHAMLFEEADAADRISVQKLLVGRHDLAADLVVVAADALHVMFHLRAPHHLQVVTK